LGQTPISAISINLQSRDEIPQILRGLQHLYLNENLRDFVFKILEDLIPDDINSNNGRPGMDSWTILVLGALGLGCGWDYDKLCEIADNHRTLREMLGIPLSLIRSRYMPYKPSRITCIVLLQKF